MADKKGGSLSTHVLDTARGVPAAGMALTLWRIETSGDRIELGTCVTNGDGRCDRPLLTPEDFEPGIYELVFQAGAYFDTTGLALPDPKFLDEITLRFGISERAHHHVPLLVSPYSYSTYRGS